LRLAEPIDTVPRFPPRHRDHYVVVDAGRVVGVAALAEPVTR